MNALVQTNNDGEWINENCYSSARGFYRMGYTVEKFRIDNMHEWNLRNFDVIHGGIKAMRKAFDLLEVHQPEIHNPHDHLRDYLGRNMLEFKFKDILKMYMENKNSSPIFIKPLTEHKLFTGKVINSFADLIPLAGINDEVLILASDVVNYISEYRCFVDRRTLIGCKNYTGDFTVLPDFKMVYGAIKDYEEQPLGYSVDFGITDKGETQLIEINDGFALGAYGLNPILYCKMIQDRYKEIKNNKL